MELPKLYGLDSKGRTKEWSVHTEGADIYVTHGLVDGKKQQRITTAKAKNVGRSNETTPEQQAKLEAKSKWNKQKDKSYCEDPDNIQPLLDPMLAHPYEKYAHKVKFPCAVQPKLDGVRCIATYEDEGLVFKSRGAKYYPVPDHLIDPISEALAVAQVFGYTKLDGELYLHGHDLNRIISAAKKPEPNKLTLEFHVFDIAEEGVALTKRINDMEFICDEVDSRYLHYVETNYGHGELDIMDYHGEYVIAGYEGVMVRNWDSLYKFDHRSQDLLKHKEFKDDEYMIVDVVQDKDGRGVFVCSCPDSTHNDKKTFTCVLKGTHEARQHVWDYKEEYIGKPLTVKFQVLTEFNMPEFPVGIAVRDYE